MPAAARLTHAAPARVSLATTAGAFLLAAAMLTAPAWGGAPWRFVLGADTAAADATAVQPDQAYDADAGFGWAPDGAGPFFARLDEGLYDVTLRYASAPDARRAWVKAEARRLVLAPQPDAAAERRFTVSVRRPELPDGSRVRLRRPTDANNATWDDRLTLEFFPDAAAVRLIEIRQTAEPLTLHLAGDSTVTDQVDEPWAGWGQMLPRFFQPGVAVANHAESGRTLYSFRGERRLAKLLSTARPGDYLFIQFGHNDQKNRAEGAGPFTTYQADLRDYIQSARDRQLIPVLVTPMERRRWRNAQPYETLTDFAEAVRQVGRELDAPVIDLHAMSLSFYRAMGEGPSTRAFVHYPAGAFPGQTRPLADDTHHNAYGAHQLARCVVLGIQQQLPELAARLRPDAGRYDPARPDPATDVAIPASALAPTETPEGS